MHALVSLFIAGISVVLVTAAPLAAQDGNASAVGGEETGSLPELPGQWSSAFADAVALWLEDDEAAALPELATLAQAGNPSAQMLLALIDKTPALQGPWLARLPREERLALMRMPGGISGRSWMHEAATTLPLAELWQRMWEVTASVDLPLEFAAAGEPRAAREAALILAAREVRGFDRIADAPGYPPSLRYLAWRERPPQRAAETASDLATLDPGDPQRSLFGGRASEPPPDGAALAHWLLSTPEAAPIAALCSDRCPETRSDCALAAWDALASHRALLILGSPSERLIPAEVFLSSRRGQATILRRIMLAVDARGRRLQIARAEDRDQCLAGLIESETQRYMPKRD